MIEPILSGKDKYMDEEWQKAIEHMADLMKEYIDEQIIKEIIEKKWTTK